MKKSTLKRSAFKRNKTTIKKKAWAIFSWFIRLRGSKNGMNQCVTCGRSFHVKQLQAGHFLPGRGNQVLFDEDGVHPQCVQCNIFKNGNWPEYLKFMVGKYGQKKVDDMMNKARIPLQRRDEDYEAIFVYYKQQVEKMEKEIV